MAFEWIVKGSKCYSFQLYHVGETAEVPHEHAVPCTFIHTTAGRSCPWSGSSWSYLSFIPSFSAKPFLI